MILLLLSFIAGGYIGSVAFKKFDTNALLIPAGLTIALALMHIVYCLLNREEVKKEEVAETAFRRQISGKGPDDVEQQRFVQGNSTAAQFIRQISGGQKPDPPGRVAGKYLGS